MIAGRSISETQATGIPDRDREALIAYMSDRFEIPAPLPPFPLADEGFVSTWQRYAARVKESGSIRCLASYLPQLGFPVAAGMSNDPDYLNATRKGIFLPEGSRQGLELVAPERCRLDIHSSCAGAIPVLTAEVRSDFVSLVQAFAARNEPVPVPPSMGASMVSGYNNWHRIHTLRSEFFEHGGLDWPSEFTRIKADRNLYQDRFLILSNGPYSDVSCTAVGLTEEQWLDRSRTIRREHECAHYFTRRLFGRMRNHAVDEMMADYAGLRQAFGRFSAQHLLLFFGLEQYPNYRQGGRLQNYSFGDADSPAAQSALHSVVWRAAWNLEEFDGLIASRFSLPEALCSIGARSLEELADPAAPQGLAESFGRWTAKQRMGTSMPEESPCEKHSTF
jgi:hypothetical protein